MEPVNDTLRTTGFVVSSRPTAELFVDGTMLSTPGGTPARAASSAAASALRGAALAGLTTAAQPAASAGPTLRVTIAWGRFHGVIAATTPTGCLITTSRLLGS